jgi:predicted kinase
VLHLTTGLPGVGKTTLARGLEREGNALRLTPDEWMQPLFGESDAGGKRDILEGRFIWVAYRALLAGADAVLDFGCWSPDERNALRAIAARADADFELHYLQMPEDERRARAAQRWQTAPGETFEMTTADHDRFLASYEPPTADELAGAADPDPPSPWSSWTAWAANRWPTLPDLGHDESADSRQHS